MKAPFTLITIFCCILLGLTSLTAQQKLTPELEKNLLYMKKLCENGRYLWVATNLGLLWINQNSQKSMLLTSENSKLPSNNVTCGVCTSGGQTYIGTDKGILMWDNYVFIRIDSENSRLPDFHILSMKLDYNETLWIVTKNAGIVKAIGDPIKPFRIQKKNSPGKSSRSSRIIVRN